MPKTPCVILGSGNIGSDLMIKLSRSPVLELTAMIGVDPDSEGLRRARKAGLDTSTDGVDWILAHPSQSRVVVEATSAAAHRSNGPLIEGAGLQSVDLTPAKLGPGVVPVVNLSDHVNAPDVSLISCGGQATIPMVAAVSSVCDVAYGEIVASIASLSAGPGTRQNIDEFTSVTGAGVRDIGGAVRGKAIIILNPADPPIMMRNTVVCQLPAEADQSAIAASIHAMVGRVKQYVPGYRLRSDPVFDEGRVTIFVEVRGAGDYLPPYAGNLDIMTAAAVRVGEDLAESWSTERGVS